MNDEGLTTRHTDHGQYDQLLHRSYAGDMDALHELIRFSIEDIDKGNNVPRHVVIYILLVYLKVLNGVPPARALAQARSPQPPDYRALTQTLLN